MQETLQGYYSIRDERERNRNRTTQLQTKMSTQFDATSVADFSYTCNAAKQVTGISFHDRTTFIGWKKRFSENVYCNNWPFNFDDDYGSITAIQSFPELTAAK